MSKIKFFLAGLLFVFITMPAQIFASDLEAYQGGGTDAKVLFVLDASGSMLLKDHKDGGQVIDYSETRMATLYNALDEVFRSDGELYNDPNLSVGFTYYGGVMGSGIKFPVVPLSLPASELIEGVPDDSDAVVKDVILSMVDGIFPRDPELYDPSGFDIKNAELWNEPYGYVYMADVPQTNIPISSIDWKWTDGNGFGGRPPAWGGQHPATPKDENGDDITDVPPGGSAWGSSNLPIAWIQQCPEPPEFSGDTYVAARYNHQSSSDAFLQLKGCIVDSSGRWDPDRCKLEGGYHFVGERVPTLPAGWVGLPDDENVASMDLFNAAGMPHGGEPQWVEGGYPGEWDSCIVGEYVIVHAYRNPYFSLYNDTRELLTPTVDALFEATRYFRGERVHYGSRDHFPSWDQERLRYVDFPAASYDYPDGDHDDPKISEPYTSGFPGNLEVLGVADKNIFTNSVTSYEKMTGGLWGWRAANPLTYADEDGGNDGPRRTYLPVTSWETGDSAETSEDEKHYLKNSIFKYDCDYRIGKTKAQDKNDEDNDGNEAEVFAFPQWSYLFNSFYGCNVVESEELFKYPTVTTEAELDAIRYGGNIGGIRYWGDDDKNNAVGDETNPGPLDDPNYGGPNPPNTGTKADVLVAPADTNLYCYWDYQNSEYCPDSTVTGDGTSSSTSGNCSEDLVRSSHYERRCEFRYQSAKLYESPIGECSNSSIILISDGHPTANTVDNNNYQHSSGNSGDTVPDLALDELYASNLRGHNVEIDTPGLIRDLTGVESCEDIFAGLGDPMDLAPDQITQIVKHEINKSGACAYELAEYIKLNNQRPNASSIGTVTTNTVGFQLDEADPALIFLQNLATKGGGQYANANNESELVTAITNMINASTKDSSDTGGVAFSLDSNTLTSSREVYAPLFKATQNSTWDANVKGYYLFAKDDGDEAFLLDNKPPVIGRSFWFDDSGISNSSAKVLAGGLNYAFLPQETHNSILASDTNPDIDPADRSTWTYPSYLMTSASRNVYVEREVWTDQKWDYLHDVSKERLGVANMSDQQLTKFLDYSYAQPIGDSLHSKPVTVEYGGNKFIIIVSNSGFLQSFRLNQSAAGDYHTLKPTEVAAWMPHSLSRNIGRSYRRGSNGEHIYGLDGPLRIWNPTVTTSDGVEVKKTYAYFGLRRGGDSYYMLDITNPGDITVVWRIDSGGGEGSPYRLLGDTWSPITLLKVNDTPSELTLNGETVTFDGTYVAAFGGGYNDTTEDNEFLPRKAVTRDDPDLTRHLDTYNRRGRGFYIIDPLTGVLHRSFGRGGQAFSENISAMNYGVPAEIRAIDANGDGLGDRLYFGDMGGQLWRADIDGSQNLASENAYNIKLLADFGANRDSTTDSTPDEMLADAQKNHRRFYTAPSVAYTNNGEIAVAIGSGYRAHPLNGVSRQPSPGIDPESGDDIEGELYPVIEDRFYLLKDTAMSLSNPANDTVLAVDLDNAVSEGDLYDATENLAASSDDSVRAQAMNSIGNASGWYIKLKEASGEFVGEKVLGSPVIFRNVISFTTTVPEGSGEACVFTPTTNRFYSINLSNGSPSGTMTEVVPGPDNTDVTIPITNTRWVEIDTSDAIVDSVDVVSITESSMDTADAGDPGTGVPSGEESTADQKSCVKFFTETTEMAKMCFEPSKIFWKETGREEVDCRFENDASCNGEATPQQQTSQDPQ